jgi:hypothetical protein
MPRKIQNTQNPLEEITEGSDNELQLQLTPKPVTKQQPVLPPIIPQQQPTPAPTIKQKRNYNITEEHKEVLKQRLLVAHQRKKELAEERRLQKDEAMKALEIKKQQKILQEAEKLKRKENKMMKDLEVKEFIDETQVPLGPVKKTAALPATVTKKKKQVILYVSDSEGDDEEEEEEIIVKPKRKIPVKQIRQPRQQQQIYQQQEPVYQQPVIQPIKWNVV